VLGIPVARFRLSVRAPGGSYLGDDDLWDRAEQQLREALAGDPFDLGVGEAAFYGPKIDVQVADTAGREETLSTVQVDHVQPERFGLEYVDQDGRRQRPVMVHRGLLSSMERLVAILLELDGGWLPTWLSPVQAVVLPVSGDEHGDHASAVAARLEGVRVEVDDDGPLGGRIRRARERRIRHVAVVGDAELAAGTVSVQGRAVAEEEFRAELLEEIRNRSR